MNNKFSTLILLILLFPLSIWGVSELINLDNTKVQIAILGTVGAAILFIVIKNDLSIDMKMLLFVTFGYFIGGKGFAYLSPVAPIYIGEIALAICSLMFIFRHKGNVFKFIGRHPIITFSIAILLLCLVRIYFDYKKFGLYSIRDFAMVYYSLFAGLVYLLMNKTANRELFQKCFKYSLLIGTGVLIISSLGARGLLDSISFGTISPHADLGAAMSTGLVFFFIQKYNLSKKQIWLAFSFILTAFIFTQKTAFPFSFLAVTAFFFLFSKMRIIIFLGVFGTLVLAVIIPLGILADNDALLGSDIVQTIGSASEVTIDTEGMANTTAWRITWWRIVYEMTMEQNPFLGLGFGADITSPFLREVYNVNYYGQEHGYARYPHNILFTIFGRLGILGLCFFMAYMVLFLRTVLSFIKTVRFNKCEATEVAMIAFVLAGFANAFVQATYEVPFAAILHWCTLGYLLHWQRLKKKKKKDSGNKSEDLLQNDNTHLTRGNIK